MFLGRPLNPKVSDFSKSSRQVIVAAFYPALEILNVNCVLDLRRLYFNRDRGLAAPDVLDPFIVTEDPKILGARLVDTASTNFNHMFNFLKIETENFARLQDHNDELSYWFFLY